MDTPLSQPTPRTRTPGLDVFQIAGKSISGFLHSLKTVAQGFSKVLFPASGRRRKEKRGHPAPRLGTAVPKNPAPLVRSPEQWLPSTCNTTLQYSTLNVHE
jgi:hypothetical protein